eukprot:MONOS_16648.1-p1 / transcript=MONOS_16648.1 / gene=MONOS_16648 / organism=Monocercomonoides_exilis_PA203 / gene_product=unspecified product / transcript_product=unspecified product / location=Mono_scaffold01963:1821-2564(-) / protein_length=248 / sequence_SO=supercontig / SO=protein_coding / is_pseudo=false
MKGDAQSTPNALFVKEMAGSDRSAQKQNWENEIPAASESEETDTNKTAIEIPTLSDPYGSILSSSSVQPVTPAKPAAAKASRAQPRSLLFPRHRMLFSGVSASASPFFPSHPFSSASSASSPSAAANVVSPAAMSALAPKDVCLPEQKNSLSPAVPLQPSASSEQPNPSSSPVHPHKHSRSHHHHQHHQPHQRHRNHSSHTTHHHSEKHSSSTSHQHQHQNQYHHQQQHHHRHSLHGESKPEAKEGT